MTPSQLARVLRAGQSRAEESDLGLAEILKTMAQECDDIGKEDAVRYPSPPSGAGVGFGSADNPGGLTYTVNPAGQGGQGSHPPGDEGGDNPDALTELRKAMSDTQQIIDTFNGVEREDSWKPAAAAPYPNHGPAVTVQWRGDQWRVVIHFGDDAPSAQVFHQWLENGGGLSAFHEWANRQTRPQATVPGDPWYHSMIAERAAEYGKAVEREGVKHLPDDDANSFIARNLVFPPAGDEPGNDSGPKPDKPTVPFSTADDPPTQPQERLRARQSTEDLRNTEPLDRLKQDPTQVYHEFQPMTSDDGIAPHFCKVCSQSRYADQHTLRES